MSPGDAITGLLLGGLLGFFGQGARAVVGLKTLADYASGPNPSENDVFNAARLIVSLIIGFLVGIAAALTYILTGGDLAKIGDHLLQFAVAGYMGTDVIEAFIAKYLDKMAPATNNDTDRDAGGDAQTASADADKIGQKVDALSDQLTDIKAAVAALTPLPSDTIPGTDYPASALSRDMKLARTNYWDSVTEAARTYDLPVAVIGAIGSKESQWGRALKPPGPAGTGDWKKRNPTKWGTAMPTDSLGWGRGLMQIDWYSNEFAKTGNWQDAHANIMFGCELLSQYIKREANRGKNVDTALRCGVSDYNGMSGPNSTYSKDVMARADWISQQGLDKVETT